MNPENPAIEKNKVFSRLVLNYRRLQERRKGRGTLSGDMRLISAVAGNLDDFFASGAVFLNEECGLAEDKEIRKEGAFFSLCHQIASERDDFFQKIVRPKLLNEDIIYDFSAFPSRPADRALLNDRFEKIVFPALTPLALDASHPFPKLQNRTLNLAAAMKRDGKKSLVLVQVPALLPRCFLLSEKPPVFVFLEAMIMRLITRLFSGPVTEVSPFRVTREEAAPALADETEQNCRGKVVRLEVQTPVSPFIKLTLMEVLELEERNVFLSGSPIDLSCLTVISDYMDAQYPPLICP
ncbi:hypothetical protein [Sporolactobacillus putidus]|uniref:Polyphosphate kinase middle domain-containing protein n=1 Tax=Sporolactobacillus putidus TaxID=492735 RepID=A0A917S3G0_9BACL|nr:hypothetical protein [Sporolactobacillus putidus]GGL52303.1 hypothetical protein GCM10007968_15480 [Sporolactobacillus putidus]